MVTKEKRSYKKGKSGVSSGKKTLTKSKNLSQRNQSQKNLGQVIKPHHRGKKVTYRKAYIHSGGGGFTDEKGQTFNFVTKKPFRNLLGKPLSFVKDPSNQQVWEDINKLGWFNDQKTFMKKNVMLVEKGIKHLTYVYHVQRKMRQAVFELQESIESRVQLIYNTVITKEDFGPDSEASGGGTQKGGAGYSDITHPTVYGPALTIVGPGEGDYVDQYKNSAIYRQSSNKFSKYVTGLFEKLSMKYRNKMKNTGKFIRHELDKLHIKIIKLQKTIKKLVVPLLKAQRSLYVIYRTVHIMNTSLLEHYKRNFVAKNEKRAASFHDAESGKKNDMKAKKKLEKQKKYRPLLDAVNKHFLKFKKDYEMILDMYDDPLRGFWIQDEYGRVVSRFSKNDSGKVTGAFVDMLKSIDAEKHQDHIVSNIMGELYKKIASHDWTFAHKQPRPTYFEVRVISRERFCYSRAMVQYYVWELLLASQAFKINPRGLIQDPTKRWVQINVADESSRRTSLVHKMMLADKTLTQSQYSGGNPFVTWADNPEGLGGYLSHGAILGYYDDDLLQMGLPEHPLKKEKRKLADKLLRKDLKGAVESTTVKGKGGPQAQKGGHQKGDNAAVVNALVSRRLMTQPLAVDLDRKGLIPPQIVNWLASGTPLESQPQIANWFRNASRLSPAQLRQAPQQQMMQQQRQAQILGRQQFSGLGIETGHGVPNQMILKRRQTRLKNTSSKLGWMDIWREHYADNFSVMAGLINAYLGHGQDPSRRTIGPKVKDDFVLEPDVYYQYWKEDIHLQFVKAFAGCGMLDTLYRSYISNMMTKRNIAGFSVAQNNPFQTKLDWVSALAQQVYAFPMVVDRNYEADVEDLAFKTRMQISSHIIPKILKTSYDTNQDDTNVYNYLKTKLLPNPRGDGTWSNGILVNSYLDPSATMAFPDLTGLRSDIGRVVDEIGNVTIDNPYKPADFNAFANLTTNTKAVDSHVDRASLLTQTKQEALNEVAHEQVNATKLASNIGYETLQSATMQVGDMDNVVLNLWYRNFLFTFYDPAQQRNILGAFRTKIETSGTKKHFQHFLTYSNALAKWRRSLVAVGQIKKVDSGEKISQLINLLDHHPFTHIHDAAVKFQPYLQTYTNVYAPVTALTPPNNDAFKVFINPKAHEGWVSVQSMLASHFCYSSQVIELVNEMTKTLNIHNDGNATINPRPGYGVGGTPEAVKTNDRQFLIYNTLREIGSKTYRKLLANSFHHLHHKMIYYLKGFYKRMNNIAIGVPGPPDAPKANATIQSILYPETMRMNQLNRDRAGFLDISILSTLLPVAQVTTNPLTYANDIETAGFSSKEIKYGTLLVSSKKVGGTGTWFNKLKTIVKYQAGGKQAGGKRSQTRTLKSKKSSRNSKQSKNSKQVKNRKTSQKRILKGGDLGRLKYGLAQEYDPGLTPNMVPFFGDKPKDVAIFDVWNLSETGEIVAVPHMKNITGLPDYQKVYYESYTAKKGDVGWAQHNKFKIDLQGNGVAFAKGVKNDNGPAPGFFDQTAVTTPATLANASVSLVNQTATRLQGTAGANHVTPAATALILAAAQHPWNLNSNTVLGFDVTAATGANAPLTGLTSFLPKNIAAANNNFVQHPYQAESTLLFPYQTGVIANWNVAVGDIALNNYPNSGAFNGTAWANRIYGVTAGNVTVQDAPPLRNTVLIDGAAGSDRIAMQKQIDGTNATQVSYVDVGLVIDDPEHQYLLPTADETNLATFMSNKVANQNSSKCNDPGNDNFATNFPHHSAAVDNALLYLNFYLKMFKTQLELMQVEYIKFNQGLYTALYSTKELEKKNMEVKAGGTTTVGGSQIYNQIKTILGTNSGGGDGSNQFYTNKWGDVGDSNMRYYNHILRDWTDGTFKEEDILRMPANEVKAHRAMSAIQRLLSIPQFADNEYTKLNKLDAKLQQQTKDLLQEELPEIPKGYPYYYHMMSSLITQRLKLKEIMTLLDPTIAAGKANLKKLGFTLAS